MIRFYKGTRALILFSFFLPFVKFCSIQPSPAYLEESYDTTRVDTLIHREELYIDSIQNVEDASDNPVADSFSDENTISNEQNQNTEESLPQKMFYSLVYHEYIEGITGFGLVVLPFSDFSKSIEWVRFILPTAFLLSIIAILLPAIRRKRALQLIHALIVICFLIILILSLEDISEMLFGFWIALLLAVVNFGLIIRVKNQG